MATRLSKQQLQQGPCLEPQHSCQQTQEAPTATRLDTMQDSMQEAQPGMTGGEGAASVPPQEAVGAGAAGALGTFLVTGVNMQSMDAHMTGAMTVGAVHITGHLLGHL